MSLFRTDPRTQEDRDDGRKRLPPGQRLTDGWPVLHYGSIPRVDLEQWRLEIFGLVDEDVTLTWDEFMALPQATAHNDIHCVTTWSKFDNDWEGVRISDLLSLVRVQPEAEYVIFHSYGGYTTNVPLAELQGPENMLVHTHDGQPLTEEHGWPLRALVPNLYLWKSAKWI
ncbi:MAG: molybdopterin-dependent oxidoreductase, partial [Chloroflexi bacterium]|nr:molybdopterin-dependent oxidoreductase [Chloroflexota bacterium]